MYINDGKWYGLAPNLVIRQWLDSKILKVFSNRNQSMILWTAKGALFSIFQLL